MSDMWKQKNGKLIKMSDMRKSHLINSYNLFKRSDRYERIDMLEKELKRRGLVSLILRENSSIQHLWDDFNSRPEFDSLSVGCND